MDVEPKLGDLVVTNLPFMHVNSYDPSSGNHIAGPDRFIRARTVMLWLGRMTFLARTGQTASIVMLDGLCFLYSDSYLDNVGV